MESLHLAVTSLGSKKRISFRQQQAEHSPEIGLIGAAAEQAMAACLVQAGGPSSLLRSSGMYKTFTAILSEFRTFISTAPPSSNFLIQGVNDGSGHRHILLERTSQFRRLAAVRAGGLHAGTGVLWEATVVQANDVADFLECLSLSSRLKPYLSNIPRCLLLNQQRGIIVEDLARRLTESSNTRINPQLLASVFLVLPDIPEVQPEWMDTFDRITVAPRQRDIAYLLDVLQHAIPATLQRTSRSGAGMPVVVRPEDPSAIPIAPQYLRRQFNEIRDQWYADIGVANGRLQSGVLDLPPSEAVRDVFAIGIENSRVLARGANFQPQEAWPFIAASLSIQGTPGPYWFLMRKTQDLGQLRSLLRRAAQIGTPTFQRNVTECERGIVAITSGQAIPTNDAIFSRLFDDIERAEGKHLKLSACFDRCNDTERALPGEIEDSFRAVCDGESIGPLLEQILNSSLNEAGKRYWTRILAEAASDPDDLPILLRVLGERELSQAYTAARKAIRQIDFRLNGPPVEQDT